MSAFRTGSGPGKRAFFNKLDLRLTAPVGSGINRTNHEHDWPMTTAARPNPSAGEPTARIDQLRRQLGALEAATGLAGDCGALFALGTPVIDAALGGGLGGGAPRRRGGGRGGAG